MSTGQQRRGAASCRMEKITLGTQDFHGALGELRFADLGSEVIVQGDVNGDRQADFEIHVKVATLSAGDFYL